jgi:hypothetical protein
MERDSERDRWDCRRVVLKVGRGDFVAAGCSCARPVAFLVSVHGCCLLVLSLEPAHHHLDWLPMLTHVHANPCTACIDLLAPHGFRVSGTPLMRVFVSRHVASRTGYMSPMSAAVLAGQWLRDSLSFAQRKKKAPLLGDVGAWTLVTNSTCFAIWLEWRQRPALKQAKGVYYSHKMLPGCMLRIQTQKRQVRQWCTVHDMSWWQVKSSHTCDGRESHPAPPHERMSAAAAHWTRSHQCRLHRRFS